jgi:SAM-dependent methyltransferase
VSAREERLVFGEVAEEYDAIRPSYPDALFDEVMEFGALTAGGRALEIGAGTGKATMQFLRRGLRVHCLEPSEEMAAILRAKGAAVVDVETTLFEDWTIANMFRLVYAAQAWHWVHGDNRYERAAQALEPGGVIALFWNKARELKGALGEAVDAAYDAFAPEIRSLSPSHWNLDATLTELEPNFVDVEKREFPWSQRYSTSEYLELCRTWSTHRMLPEDRLARLLSAVANAIVDNGGVVDVEYDTQCYLGRRA